MEWTADAESMNQAFLENLYCLNYSILERMKRHNDISHHTLTRGGGFGWENSPPLNFQKSRLGVRGGKKQKEGMKGKREREKEEKRKRKEKEKKEGKRRKGRENRKLKVFWKYSF